MGGKAERKFKGFAAVVTRPCKDSYKTIQNRFATLHEPIRPASEISISDRAMGITCYHHNSVWVCFAGAPPK